MTMTALTLTCRLCGRRIGSVSRIETPALDLICEHLRMLHPAHLQLNPAPAAGLLLSVVDLHREAMRES